MDRHSQNKSRLAELRQAQYDFAEREVKIALASLVSPDAIIHCCAPIGDLTGPDALYENAYRPLLKAVPDLERRDYIVMAGRSLHECDWVGCGGYYTGLFQTPWLDIPPTGHQINIRFHEFYRFEKGKIVEIQAIWDLPSVMMQAGAWPMQPGLGLEFHIPGPATQDGLVPSPHDEMESQESCQLVVDMLEHLTRHPKWGGPEIMEMPRFWHERMNWYGPAGIGSCRGIRGFRDWHQIPFLNAMPDRGSHDDELHFHFFGDGNYAAVTGWPNMMQTISKGGWLGIAPSGQKIALRSLDFWRIENRKIRENWVLVDLIDVYDQIGVDVFSRLREFNKARSGFDKGTGRALA